MAIGYRPVCESKPGLWPCFPSMPRFGLMGLGMLTGRYTYGLGAVNPIVPRYGLGGLTFDGTGLFGTGLFSGDISTWGISEAAAGLIGAYALYAMFYQGKQTKYRAEAAAGRRRKRRAAKYREKAKRLEASQGLLGGLF